jgi:hypothetical protein
MERSQPPATLPKLMRNTPGISPGSTVAAQKVHQKPIGKKQKMNFKSPLKRDRKHGEKRLIMGLSGKPAQMLGLCALFVSLLAGAARIDFDHVVDFGKFHTYSWIGVNAEDELWNPRIKKDIAEELTAKGWKQVEHGSDVSIAAYGSTLNETSLRNWYDGFGGGWGWHGFGDVGMVAPRGQMTPVGTLNVDMFDTSTRKLVWRGSSVGALSSDVKKDEKKLKRDLADMFAKFPPASK